MYEGVGVLILSQFKKISHENEKFGLIETKLFHFHRIFQNGGRQRGFEQTPTFFLFFVSS